MAAGCEAQHIWGQGVTPSILRVSDKQRGGNLSLIAVGRLLWNLTYLLQMLVIQKRLSLRSQHLL